ncbi:MAG: sulfurtransferase TusA family protein [Coriobacteriia bacterium]|nr:sulfurtransferase TusA family protein [Coriobacteriia bacterium]
MIEVDARGLSCPLPVMRTKKALESNPDALVVLADSGTAKVNVNNLLVDAGFDVTVTESGEDYRIEAKR